MNLKCKILLIIMTGGCTCQTNS